MIYTGTARIVSDKVNVTARCPSVCSVPAWTHSSKPAAAGLLLRAGWVGDVDRSLHSQHSAAAAGECGQCHVVSVRGRLNTDLLNVRPQTVVMMDSIISCI